MLNHDCVSFSSSIVNVSYVIILSVSICKSSLLVWISINTFKTYTYILQNNQNVEEKQNKFTNKIAFPVDDVTFRLSMCFAKPRISEWDFPHSMSPDSISEWEIWYFRSSDDWRTPK